MSGFETILPFLKPIEHLILDDSISEVMVNGPDQVFVEKAGFVEQVHGVSIRERSLLVAVKNIARRLRDDISEAKPILDSRLPDGSRVAAVIPFVVRVHHETDALYHGQDFHVQEEFPESPRHLGDSQNSSRRIPTGHRSQSEADWAYAKRALARGDNSEQIIQRIADYRADDKADPYYYARLTVIKAQLALMSPEQGRVVAPESISLTGRDH